MNMNVAPSNHDHEKGKLAQSITSSSQKESSWGRCFKCLKIDKCQCNMGCFKFISFFDFCNYFKPVQPPVHHSVEAQDKVHAKPVLSRQGSIRSINTSLIYDEKNDLDKIPELKRQFSMMLPGGLSDACLNQAEDSTQKELQRKSTSMPTRENSFNNQDEEETLV